jgi:Arc/MetJ-type ribon-helix-helix transcriptional regulator
MYYFVVNLKRGEISLKTKIDFMLSGELAKKVIEYIERGYFASKPEVVRQALRHLFDEIEDNDLRSARLRSLLKN